MARFRHFWGQEYYIDEMISLHHIRKLLMPVCPITDAAKFASLAISTRLLHFKYLFPFGILWEP